MGPETTARVLFERLLTDEQLIEWRRARCVTVPLSQGGWARITGPVPFVPSFRIQWSDAPAVLQCVIPESDHAGLPRGDTLIAQLLYLRNEPNRLRRIGHPRLPQLRSARWGLLDWFRWWL